MFGHIFSKTLFLLIFVLALPLSVEAALVNINTAVSEELQTLNGIGPAYAQRIIDYRNANGPFAAIEDIKNVSGIGEVTFQTIKDFITVGDNVASGGTPSTDNSSASNVTTGIDSSSTLGQPLPPFSKLKAEINVSPASTVGTPLVFRAKTNFDGTKKFTINWSFGDGSIAYGEVVEHSYLYPGEYVVALNISVPEGIVTARRNIMVAAPELLISGASSESIEITNKSKSEINLFGRALMSRGQAFTFPQDTIILPGQKINFASAVTGLSPDNTADVYVMTVGDNPQRSYNGVMTMEKARLKEITRIENELSALQQELALAWQGSRALSSKVAGVNATTEKIAVETADGDREPDSLLTANAFSASESIGKLNLWQKIKRFFLRTQ